jgi:hypothetical protein
MLLAVRQFAGADVPPLERAIAFADLRDQFDPVPDESVLGCMISMLRFNVRVGDSEDVLDIAQKLRRKMFRAGRAGDPFLYSVMSKHVTRLALHRRKDRMASVAMSFLGKLNLEPRYGRMELEDVHAFITNNEVGPELSGFGKVLFGRIELDLTYLASEIPDYAARELLSRIQVSLSSLGTHTND